MSQALGAASRRPDLDAHYRAAKASPNELIKSLRELLGARLTAYISRVDRTSDLHHWADNPESIPQDRLDALRDAYEIAVMLSQHDRVPVVRAWFAGLNPQLGDQSPAFLLREGKDADVGPRVRAAALAYLVGG